MVITILNTSTFVFFPEAYSFSGSIAGANHTILIYSYPDNIIEVVATFSARRVKRFRRQESGISDIIANIIILAITVIMFSGILAWVYLLPAPAQTLTLDLSATLESAGNVYWLNITKKGGDPLSKDFTRIVLIINTTDGNQTTEIKRLANSTVDLGDYWDTGEVWRYLWISTTPVCSVRISVVDINRNVLVWSAGMPGGIETNFAPIITNRWTSPSPMLDDDTGPTPGLPYSIYVQVIDPDNNLDINTVMITDPKDGSWKTMANPSGDKKTFVHSGSDAEVEWNGRVLSIRASDKRGNTVSSTMTIQVVRYTIINQSQAVGGGNPVETALSQTSGMQRYDIFNATEWDTKGWNAVATRSFKRGEDVVVVVASKYLMNVAEKNIFYLYNQSTLPPIPIVYSGSLGTTSRPSCTQAFTALGYNNGYYIWIYRFDTDANGNLQDGPLEYGYYPLEIELKAQGIPQPNRFWTMDTISVTDQFGNVPDYPQLLTYKNAAHTIPSSSFNFTETVYVKIVVRDTDASFTIGDVQVKDFSGGIQVWAAPGNTPVSTAVINNTRSYAFSIDLSRPNVDRWLFGTNDYALKINSVVDQNETYLLSGLIEVKGPRWYLDITAGMHEVRQPAWDIMEYLNFYKNDLLWSKRSLATYIGPGGQADYNDIYAAAFGDMDGDSDLDIVASTDKGHVLYYRNQDGEGDLWSQIVLYGTVNNRAGIGGTPPWGAKKIYALDVGRTDKDDDCDIVIGTEEGELWYIANDGSWSTRMIDDVGPAVWALELADMTNDGYDDLVVGTDDGYVHVYYNNGDGIFGTYERTNYTMSEDTQTVIGTRTGSYTDTQTENGVYERLTEAWITAYTTIPYTAVKDIKTEPYTVSGDYTYTHSSDDVRQTLTEYDKNPGAAVDYVIDDTGTRTGHIYDMGSITVPSGSTVYLNIEAYLNIYDEDFELGWSTDNVTINWPGWKITSTTETKYQWDLSSVGYTGGQLYIYIDDIDDKDDTQTTIYIDHLHVDVVAPSGNTSALEHIWKSSTIGTGGNAYKFYIIANKTGNDEDDDFLFSWSLNQAGPYSEMVRVKYYGVMGYVYTFTSTEVSQIAGNAIYIKVTDTDRTSNRVKNDTVYIDHMYIQRIVVTPNSNKYSIGGKVTDVAVGFIDSDKWRDIAAVNDLKELYVLWNLGGSPPSFNPVKKATDPQSKALLSVGIGDVNLDGKADIITGNDGGGVYIFRTDGNGNIVQTIELEDGVVDGNNIGKVNTLRVGDVNGDWWDDVVIGTDNGYIYYYENRRTDGTGWLQKIVDIEIATRTKVYVVDLGDADRGITV